MTSYKCMFCILLMRWFIGLWGKTSMFASQQGARVSINTTFHAGYWTSYNKTFMLSLRIGRGIPLVWENVSSPKDSVDVPIGKIYILTRINLLGKIQCKSWLSTYRILQNGMVKYVADSGKEQWNHDIFIETVLAPFLTGSLRLSLVQYFSIGGRIIIWLTMGCGWNLNRSSFGSKISFIIFKSYFHRS